ncbi:MAG: radical SAM protein [Oscillospiraceae bacterium]|jgi:putative methyltransferase|nr:radical SAM protein [Oscillospiraceae bacterium]
MTKKNIYLAQVDTLRKLPTHYTVYLPYAVGTLWAYAKQSADVSENYQLAEMLFMRDPVEDVVARMDNPFLVGFSCYIWSTEYNKALAQAVKKAFPDCYILFGGHNVPADGVMLDELPYVDFLMHDEGEIPFQALLIELAKETPDWRNVPAISFRTAEGTQTNPTAVADSVEDFPSPYLEGLFDAIVERYPHIQWSTVWETNRGCPHHCAYCDWGEKKSRVRPFSMERLLAEIEWISTHNVGFVYGADANFGILPRDEGLLDALAEAKSRTGLPRLFDVNTTKIFNDQTFRITEKLNASGLDQTGASFSAQSLSPVVLKNIGRVNIDEEKVRQWLARCRKAGYRTHTDLIIGLPGETLQSYCAGVEKMFTLGQHEGIRYFPCNLLVNAPMADPAYREKHGIHTIRTIFRLTMEAAPDPIDEFIDVVDATATMPYPDSFTAIYFMQLVHGAHCFGLLRFIAMLLHTEGIVSYADFYLHLLDFCSAHEDTLIGQTVGHMCQNFFDMAHGKETQPLQIEGFSYGRMGHDQYFVARALLDPERFYADVDAFLQQFSIAPELREQLLKYQRESLLMPGGTEKTRAFDYDFPAYFHAIYEGTPIPLVKRPVRLRFRFEEGTTDADLVSPQKYFHAIVQLGRFTSKAFYKIEEQS